MSLTLDFNVSKPANKKIIGQPIKTIAANLRALYREIFSITGINNNIKNRSRSPSAVANYFIRSRYDRLRYRT